MRARMWGSLALLMLIAPVLVAGVARGEVSRPIEDNSFLIEEAYNQEPRVVQHIFTWMRPRGGGSWEAGFTQEWPVASQRHQLSYTIPVQLQSAAGGGEGGIGDLALHYRYQAVGVTGGRVAFAPRLSWSWPTGNSDRGFGTGRQGFQFNLPVSVALTDRWVSHSNAGVARTHAPGRIYLWPQVAPPDTRRVLSLGQSLIWLATPRVNLMLELAWERSEAPGFAGDLDFEESLLLAPGVRWSHDFANGLQIVPGIAVPIGIGRSRGERSVFLYASFEHGF